MEYCNGGDLLNLKKIKHRFKEHEARLILQQLVNGFKEIYKQQVMHRDLKLANILVHIPSLPVSKNKDFLNQVLTNIDLVESGI